MKPSEEEGGVLSSLLSSILLLLCVTKNELRSLPRKLSKETLTNIGRRTGRQAQTVPSDVSMNDQYHVGAAESAIKVRDANCGSYRVTYTWYP